MLTLGQLPPIPRPPHDPTSLLLNWRVGWRAAELRQLSAERSLIMAPAYRFETILLNTCEEAMQYCSDVGVNSVKVHLDTFHMNIEEDSIPNAIRLAGDRLGHLHVGEGNRKLPGKGSMPWEEIGKALRDIGYDKAVVMEPFVKPGGQVGKDIKVWRDLSGGADAETMDREIKDSLAFLKREFHV
jgi:D-psicose/D-tagatose/L-ribulose 3-epimerase